MSESAAPVPAPEGNEPELIAMPPAPEPKARRARGAFNKSQLIELNKATLVAHQALKTAHIGKLTEEGKDVAFVNALVAKILSAGQHGTGAVGCSAERVSMTVSSAAAKKKLVQRLRQIQAKAKLKYQFDDPAKLRSYLVGEPIASSRAMLEQSAQTILKKANDERPGGIDTTFIIAGEGERTEYVNSKTKQRDKQAEARAERTQRDGFVASVKRARIELQLAADAAWPAGVVENAAVRVLFFLKPNRAYSA
jgi:hypothetical protein